MKNYRSYAYHWMRREIGCDWKLGDGWLDELLIMRGKRMSRLSSLLGPRDEWVRYPEKPLFVVWCHLSRNYTELPWRHQMVWKMQPLVIYIITCHKITNRRRRDRLKVAKLLKNPLRSNVHHNLTPSELADIRRYQVKAPDSPVLSIEHPTHVSHSQGIPTSPIRGSLDPRHMSLTRKPPAGPWAPFIISIMNDGCMHCRKVLVYPALQTHSQHQ